MENSSVRKTFASFAAKRFCNNHTITAEEQPLNKPLLSFSSKLDQEASRAISFAIYHYTQEGHEPVGPSPIRSIYRELISGLQQGSKGNPFSPYPLIHGRKTSDLDKVQFIGGLGILGPQLRDEIFCQICKQINGNPTARSQQKAWSLLACCLCLFLPSDEFLPHLEDFINSGPEIEKRFCTERLRRTRQNGNRYEPLAFTEHEAIVKRTTFTRGVSLLNGQACNCKLDPATTGIELRKQIKAAVGVVDLFGFSFQVDIGNRVTNIVSGSDHVMDVVSSCEQGAREINLYGDWFIVFYKEIFSPWQTPSLDPKATELIYNQIIAWVKLGRYKITEDEILAKIAATHCYVLHGPNANMENISNAVTAVIPGNLTNKKDQHRSFVQATAASFAKKFRHLDGAQQEKYVEELVNYAKHKMTGNFTRYFDLVQDPNNLENTSILSVNWNHIRVYQKERLAAWTLAFPEIMKISYERLKDRRVGTITIHTIHGDDRQLASIKAEEIHQLLTFLLSGLRKRSKFLLALQDYNAEGSSLHLLKGDLVVLKGSCDGASVQATGRGQGTCVRSTSSGKFSGGLYYIIPTIKQPSQALLEALRNGAVSDVEHVKVNKVEKVSASFKSRSSLIRTGTSVVNAQKPSKPMESSEMFLKEYENLRYPMNKPAAPNIHEILKPVVSEHQQNGALDKVPQKPKREMLFAENGEYLDLSGYPAASKYGEFSHSATDKEIGEQSKAEHKADHMYSDFFSGPKKPGSKSLSISSDSSTKDSYEDMSAPANTVTTATTSSATVAVTTVNVVETSIYTSVADQQGLNESSLPDIEPFPQLEEIEHSTDEQETRHETEVAQTTESSHEISSTSVVKNGVHPGPSPVSASFKDTPCYNAIVTYVSQPAGDIMLEMKLTDTIFGKPLSKVKCEDDVYLEIMRNIQAEAEETAVERSWELMWLTTGLYPCSDVIKDEVISFLRSRTDGNPLARQCYTRLVKMITHGRRTYPPHIAEVQAIQTRMDLINHKVFFPDGSCQSFEVESTTTARHLISVITESIGLKYPNGCGLFFKIGEKVFGAADEYFFFDFIQHFIEVWRKDEKGEGIVANYQVFFLRKVWINVIPGADRVADCRLHYYQELSKYLRGYHKCTKEESIAFAALIFRAEFGEDTDNLSEIPDTLNKLVPQNVISEMTVDQWEQTLGEAILKNSEYVGDDAKVEILKRLSMLPTFGSAFFHAKPTVPSDLPETVLIAIQRDGFAVMRDIEKTIIEKYGFDKVTWWSSGEHVFRVDIDTENGKKRFGFLTSLDYQIDDFLTSYISVHGADHHGEESITSDEEH